MADASGPSWSPGYVAASTTGAGDGHTQGSQVIKGSCVCVVPPATSLLWERAVLSPGNPPRPSLQGDAPNEMEARTVT